MRDTPSAVNEAGANQYRRQVSTGCHHLVMASALRGEDTRKRQVARILPTRAGNGDPAPLERHQAVTRMGGVVSVAEVAAHRHRPAERTVEAPIELVDGQSEVPGCKLEPVAVRPPAQHD